MGRRRQWAAPRSRRAGLDGLRGSEASLVMVVSIWAGMSIGVSFLATPAKFGAPSLTLPVALDVGRHTFGVFNPIEIGLAVIATALAALARRRAILALVALVATVVALQAVWLLPVLDARVETILAGGAVPSSPLHALYIGLETAKLLALLTAGAVLLWQGKGRARQSPVNGRTSRVTEQPASAASS